MDRRHCLGLIGALPLWGVPGAARAALADTVARMKPSVVLVGTWRETDSPRFQLRGSGFLAGRPSQVVTCAHVLPTQEDGAPAAQLVAQVWQRESGWSLRQARVLGTERHGDIALLGIDGPPGPLAALGDSSAVREGDDLAFMGFPIGNVLGYAHVVHRAMVSSIATSAPPSPDADRLRGPAIRGAREGAFDIFQLDAVAYPGNSGGPLFRPETGEVVGMMNMVLIKGTRESALSQPSGIAYAIPSARVRELMRTQR
ncbi:S1C family serine protease [Hydrogenophaga borbori]|uniref:S1C family serine protease n=1 Tax=Hydrogenophaga borbori TaxID=2294117 RepID=UPI00301DCA45